VPSDPESPVSREQVRARAASVDTPSMTVAASYDLPPRFAPTVATVQLFAPGSLRDFVLELGGDDRLGPRAIGPRPR
jgi:hypothetical protein